MATQSLHVFIDDAELWKLLVSVFEEHPLLLLAHLTIGLKEHDMSTVVCLNCQWEGPEEALVELLIPDSEDGGNYILHPHPEPACPRCRSLAWEEKEAA